jgi:hypothetical protein
MGGWARIRTAGCWGGARERDCGSSMSMLIEQGFCQIDPVAWADLQVSVTVPENTDTTNSEDYLLKTSMMRPVVGKVTKILTTFKEDEAQV